MATPAPQWVPLGGKSRRYLNPATGETISRRAYDRQYGRLAGIALTQDQIAALRGTRTTRGQGRGVTDFYDAPHDAGRMRDTLDYLMRKEGVGMVRFIYRADGLPNATSEWFRLTPANLPHIVDTVMFHQLRYPPDGPAYLPGDLYLIVTAPAVARAA